MIKETESKASRETSDSTSLAARTRAEEDFDITLRLRRSAAQKEQAEQKAQAESTAKATIDDARETVRQMIADATREVRRLHGVRDDSHAAMTTLRDQLDGALQQSLAATPDEPELPRSAPAPRPRPTGDA